MTTTTATALPRQRKPRPKPERRYHITPEPWGERVLTIVVGKLVRCYYLSAVPSDFGRGFRLEKLGIDGGNVYHLHLGHDGTKMCECRGHLRWGTDCKHILTVLDLIADGQL
jgi:hypothetical protein